MDFMLDEASMTIYEEPSAIPETPADPPVEPEALLDEALDGPSTTQAAGDAIEEVPKVEEGSEAVEPPFTADNSAQGSYAQVAATTPGAQSAVVEHNTEPQTNTAVPAVAFPVQDDASSHHASSINPAPSTGVTFSPEVDSPPSRPGTPDSNAQPKRKRISSQNFQRLARRISLGGRRGSSGSTSTQTLQETATSTSPKEEIVKSTEAPAESAVKDGKKSGKRKKNSKGKKTTE